jgi:hypothetical protein
LIDYGVWEIQYTKDLEQRAPSALYQCWNLPTQSEGRRVKPVIGKGREYEARQAEFVRFMTNLDKLELLPSNTFGPFLEPGVMGEEKEAQMTRSSCWTGCASDSAEGLAFASGINRNGRNQPETPSRARDSAMTQYPLA